MNEVTVSEDGMHMTISTGHHCVTMRSARPGGFSETDIEKARVYELNSTVQPGQINRAWLRHFAGQTFIVQVHTGPRAEVGRHKVMVGWLRLLVAVGWKS